MSTTEIPYGTCHCGCGQPSPLAKKTDRSTGRVEGQPMRFVSGHNLRGMTLSEETRRKIGDTQRGKPKSEEFRRMRSTYMRGPGRRAGSPPQGIRTTPLIGTHEGVEADAGRNPQ